MHEEMKLAEFYRKYDREIEKLISSALKEDDVFNDVTSNTLISKHDSRKLTAVLLCKEDCIAAGIDMFKRVYRQIDPRVKFKIHYKDGDLIRNKKTVLEVESTLRNLLVGERTALNFLQKMSGIATLTNRFVKLLKYKEAKILHTRKTTPNFRLPEIAAVKTGGGDFHRMSLSSEVMIKDNHIACAGSIKRALDAFRSRRKYGRNLEIEVKSLSEAKDVIRFGRDLVVTVMLDNFRQSSMKKAVAMLKRNGFRIEVSGGINETNFVRKQLKGIDYYSIGMLTHSYKSIDFSLEF